ncbi:hypothetical protein FOMPIDRAFT_87148 [Fomitopsis schrenkii]|uniref:Uncharacterized protein n=1 Tax=Fomitopsis schrenkii TaxID=2126942 RepID=S8ENE9_FOMSC|nr:hypothetical protein FOMPIDRAFT_87148 [Fomitopsis schrenkii]
MATFFIRYKFVVTPDSTPPRDSPAAAPVSDVETFINDIVQSKDAAFRLSKSDINSAEISIRLVLSPLRLYPPNASRLEILEPYRTIDRTAMVSGRYKLSDTEDKRLSIICAFAQRSCYWSSPRTAVPTFGPEGNPFSGVEGIAAGSPVCEIEKPSL